MRQDRMADSGAEILELHCDGNKTWTSPLTNVTYQVPDEVSDVVDISAALDISDSMLAKTVAGLRNSLSADVRFEVPFGLGSFSESTTYKTSKDRLQNLNKFVASDRAYISILSLSWLRVIPATSLSPFFKFDLDDLPDRFDSSTAERYLKLFTTYGSHYFRRGLFGGSLSTWFEIDSNVTPRLRLTDAGIREQVNAYFLYFLKTHGAFTGKSLNLTLTFSQATVAMLNGLSEEIRIYSSNKDTRAGSGHSQPIHVCTWVHWFP